MKNKILLIICAIVFAGCEKEGKVCDLIPYHDVVCSHECLENTFNMFGHSESQFLGGAASSSMGGMNQSKIFDRVISYCKDIKKEDSWKCCNAQWRNCSKRTHHVIIRFGDSGYCKEK